MLFYEKEKFFPSNVNFLFLYVYIGGIIMKLRRLINMTTKNLIFTALMTAIIAVLGFVPSIPLPFMPVPIVVQNIGIFLAGILLGRKYGTLSVIVFLLLVAAGLPLLSGGRGSIGSFAGPSAGFLFLYPVVAYLIGLVRDLYYNKINLIILLGATLVIGVLMLDIVGTIIMGMITNLPFTKSITFSLAFIPGDVVKAIIASVVGNILLNHTRFQQLLK